jgi:hypothetical protein
LDPRKKGKYQYGEFTFGYEPFYMGKGRSGINRDQLNTHLAEAKRNTPLNKCSNTHKIAKIRKILKEDLEPIILKVEDNLKEQEAFDLEIWLIWAIGRSDLKLGPLTNQTSGGEGGSGNICSEETRLKISKSCKGKSSGMLGKKHTTETLEKMSKYRKGKGNAMYGKKHSEETKKKFSLIHKGKIISKEQRVEVSQRMRGNTYSKGNIISKHQREINSEFMKNNNYNAKSYNLIFPDGSIKEIYNMAKFCRENNLCVSHMSSLNKGKIKEYKGFKIQQENPSC